ncbi:HD domain-containing protein 2 [Wickerhamomyces ciferrii]|uniref:5'-deoxynucleotidase n=1 Tax=Wickerhamomyces ciferrii (strain ATCC 14091 / BCRC 22168 / CBS 111 / JCM 3599 / NBRC 0793 / NRRL Y-1031 F-60-10) TaxID=1206466 RepID=K0KP42_WICCF|nr:HD domain-containing protein 2 [Wickerhamomyces ciferrii]CCH47050.1 HD domain-containing protein 2 [Wickerhamomyces ciferrii]
MTTESNWTVENSIPQNIKTLLTPANSKSSDINYVLIFLQIVSLLKSQRRTGWVDHGIPDCESISDHMYRMGITSMLITNPEVDTSACVKISLVHDIAESLVGDITPFDGVTKEEKHRREFETIKYLSELIGKYNQAKGKEILEYWLDYEEIRTLEARYVKDIDKFEMLLQSFEYETKFKGEKKLDQFWGARSSIKTDEIKSWTDELFNKREEFWKSIEKK